MFPGEKFYLTYGELNFFLNKKRKSTAGSYENDMFHKYS
jgi:hypothetical protein